MSEPAPEKSTADDPNAPRLRPATETIGQLNEALSDALSPDESVAEEAVENVSPIVRMANAIITTAIEKRASDISIEPAPDCFYVRCRVDGVRQQVMSVPRHVYIPTMNRFKVMADIPFWAPAPQSGFIPIRFKDKQYDLSVTTTPTHRGDVLLMRLFDPELPLSGLPALGMDTETENALWDDTRYGGLLLIVGPPRQGKTTTAYALMSRENWVGHIAATLESTRTYTARGLVQTYRTKHNSARSLAHNLITQGSSVVFCGSLTDVDMADAALSLAATGSRVIACVTASSAAGAIQQLLDMGIAPARLASLLSGVLMQTLAPTLCPDCRVLVEVGPEESRRLQRFHVPPDALALPPQVAARGDGCATCDKRTVRGQVGLFEYLPFDSEARHLLRRGDPALQIARSPWAQGAANALHRAALAAVRAGRISLSDAENAVFPLTGAARRLL